MYAVRDLRSGRTTPAAKGGSRSQRIDGESNNRRAAQHHIVRRKENPAPSKQGPQRTHVAASAECSGAQPPRHPGAQQPRDPGAQQPRVGRDASLGDRVLPVQQGLFERPHQFFPISHRGAGLHGVTGLFSAVSFTFPSGAPGTWI